MLKKSGLGKGMAALLPVVAVAEDKNYFLCPIEQIRPNPNQPRKQFAPEKLEELAASIKEKGIIQPLVVTKKDGYYEIIAGERRWRASQKAGLRELPVVIREASPDAVMELALIENIQREDLNAIEEAQAYKALVEQLRHLSGRGGPAGRQKPHHRHQFTASAEACLKRFSRMWSRSGCPWGMPGPCWGLRAKS